ncbi:pirin family protein [Ornithinimicrobium cryptoxanthini]|uniref:Pirin family protein n=1 Tax=Ornithinimicrobium cryptoxanthini TaxID=2934161 RepID=A0ABY4YGK6_9MICO|nr:pirin family protein [Ornithinimicrobium cryptoxanthini]USQ75878.1 pirin family protein [Ornithinimicrobium cryptoxanthini]
MSNLEIAPAEVEGGADQPGPALEVIAPREVPLGGPRAMTVRRTLPTRGRTTIGAWCFADHYGPDAVAQSGGMVVPPHPHTGLQTVSWLFTGEIEHRDSTGVHAMVRPGELNLMTAGQGVSHSEVSTPAATTLHGVQLWTVLPDGSRAVEPGFEHYVPEPVDLVGGRLAVFLGQVDVDDPGLDGPVSSSVTTYTPLLGAELTVQPGAVITLRLDPTFEHGVLVDGGPVSVGPEQVGAHDLAYLAPGQESVELRAGEHGARVILLGGPPFGEQIVMWWNFIGRTHDEVEAFRAEWQERVASGADTRFGIFDYDGDPLPAPSLPGVRLKPRG